MIAASDAYFIPGLAWMLLARTLVECGKPDDARAAATKALALYEVKGDLPAAGWARQLLASLEARSRAPQGKWQPSLRRRNASPRCGDTARDLLFAKARLQPERRSTPGSPPAAPAARIARPDVRCSGMSGCPSAWRGRRRACRPGRGVGLRGPPADVDRRERPP